MITDAERAELRASVQKLFATGSAEAAVRRTMTGERGMDDDLWRRLGDDELGVLGLHVPERFGGAGHGFGELAVVLGEAGASLACVPLLASAVLATSAILRSDDDAEAARLLPGLVSGRTVGALAVHEPATGWAVERPSTRVSGGLLSGAKSFVVHGLQAELLVVSADGPDGPSLYTVAADHPGVTRTPLEPLDLTRPLADVTFDSVPATPLGRPGGAAAVLTEVFQLAAVCLAAEQVGAAARVVLTAAEYAKTRVQFGRAIGSFQAVKHRCADMQVALVTAQAVAEYALTAADSGTDLPIAAAVAHAYCSESFFDIAAGNVQIHGGIGFTWEHSAHLYFKRAKSSALLFGDAAQARAELGRHLGAA